MCNLKGGTIVAQNCEYLIFQVTAIGISNKG